MEDASGSPNLTNAGTHFALGEGEDFYSIWDRAAMGQPVYRFPKTQDGWLVAWNTLAELQESGIRHVDAAEDTSGQGDAALIPEKLRGWNWGAFLLSWIWGWGTPRRSRS